MVDDDVKPSDRFLTAVRHVMTEGRPAAFPAIQILLRDMALEDNWYYPTEKVEQLYAVEGEWSKVSAEATASIVRMLNEGVAHVDFFGHGSVNVWADERIWFGMDSPNRDSQHLKCDGRYAFIANYTCSTGAIDYPIPPWNLCISEDLMRQPGGGAIGMFVPSAPGSTPDHEPLALQWYKALFRDNLRGLGELVTLTRARHAMADTVSPHSSAMMLKMYLLLGDPALRLRLVERWRPLTLSVQAIPVGGAVAAILNDVDPAHGQALAWVEDAPGKAIWKSEPTAYRGGTVRLDVPVDKGLKTPCDLRVCVYCWNEGEGGDLLASAQIRVEEPSPAATPASAPGLTDPAHLKPRLRIGEAIQVKPERPTDGQTIFVTFMVENAGTTASAPCAPVLLDGPPDQGGRPLPVYGRREAVTVPALQPAASTSVTLRWDPIKNAGVQTIWIDLRGAGDAEARREQIRSCKLYVRTKSILTRTRPPWATMTAEDKLADRVTLHAEVVNEGETDAHDVEVKFYKTPEMREQDLIGKPVLLKHVPSRTGAGPGRAEAQLVWKFDRDEVMRDGKFTITPAVDIRLKGSAQRVGE